MPQDVKSKQKFTSEDRLIQGAYADASDINVLCEAIRCAVDYRGDVTITRRSTDEPISGFVFDEKQHDDPEQHLVRMIPKDQDTRLAIPLSDVATIQFSGRDTAAGKSFETWMKKYVEKKLAGQKASIESDPLDE